MASSLRSAPSAPRRPDVLGVEAPRLWTRPLRPLTPETSRGFEAVAFAEDVLGLRLHPWQRWLLIHALELLEDGSFRFRTLVVLVGRQNGKTTLVQVLALWRMYVDQAPLVIGTAQNLDVAEEAWQGAVEIAEGVPELAAEIAHVDKTNGKKQLRLESGERYKVAAASRRGGRGLSGDLVVLDELREHQTWAAWGAVTKTTMARPRAQIVCLSNAGDAESVVLASLRDRALAVLEGRSTDADDGSLGIFEWSAVDGCALDDPQGWAQANPSLGHPNGVSEAAIRSALATDPEAVFRTEVLCQWVERTDPPALPMGLWDVLADPDAPRGHPAFAVATAPDHSWAAIGVAWRRPDGLTQVMLADYKPGRSWVTARMAELRATWGGAVVADSASRGLVADADEPGITAQAQAHGAFADAVETGTVRHGNEAALNMAVKHSRWRPMGETRVFDRKSDFDISPLVAVALAASVVAEAGPSLYEERGVLVL